MTHNVKDIQNRFGVGEHTVLGWIISGDLQAINVCRTGSTRAKWRITETALAQFELDRTKQPQFQTRKRARRKKKNVIEFY